MPVVPFQKQRNENAVPHVLPRSAVQRGAEHLDALYVLAYLYSGEQVTADRAVIDAVSSLCVNPAAQIAGPVWVWRILADRVHGQHGGTPSPDGRSIGLADRGKIRAECVALAAAGRTLSEIASLLGVPTGQVRRELDSGKRTVTEDGRYDRGDADGSDRYVEAVVKSPALRLVPEATPSPIYQIVSPGRRLGETRWDR